VLVATVSIAACGEKTIDSGELEAKLAGELAPQAGVKASDVAVSCPSDQEVSEGARFDCTLTAPNGDEVRVAVTLTDDEGGFRALVPPQRFR
jgi:Domain of unknown function (DUF4333)